MTKQQKSVFQKNFLILVKSFEKIQNEPSKKAPYLYIISDQKSFWIKYLDNIKVTKTLGR